jgi:hypothetical protein
VEAKWHDEAGETINFGAKAVYKAGKAAPVAITIVAEGDKWFSLAVSVLNGL